MKIFLRLDTQDPLIFKTKIFARDIGSFSESEYWYDIFMHCTKPIKND